VILEKKHIYYFVIILLLFFVGFYCYKVYISKITILDIYTNHEKIKEKVIDLKIEEEKLKQKKEDLNNIEYINPDKDMLLKFFNNVK